MNSQALIKQFRSIISE